MNKHLLETRIKSIKHYQSEIQRLQEAIKVNKETIYEIEKSLTEFFPFKKGDIIYRNSDKRMFKIVSVREASIRENNFDIIVEVHYQDGRYGFLNSTTTVSYTLDQWNEFKKIGEENGEEK